MKKITLIAGLLLAGHLAQAQDTCGTALPISGSGLYVVSGINGSQVPTPICAANGANNSGNAAGEWYVYTPTQDYTVTITTSIAQNNPLVDTRVHIYTGSCGALTCYAGDDDSGNGNSSLETFNVTGGLTYYIAWDNKWTSNGFTFQVIENTVVIPDPVPVSFTPMSLSTNGSAECLVDMNKDHLDDLVSVTGTNIRINYQNANGTFTTTDYPTTQATHQPSWSITAGDYNRDGYNDLLYGGGSGLTFMRSNGLGTGFTQDTPGQYIFCQRTNFVDINNDGNLDAFSCHDVDPNVYYMNNGAETNNWTYYQSGTTPGAYMLGITPSGGNYASLWTDYDNDGDLDMFISKCSGPPSELHRNDGNGVFTDISAIAGVNILPITSWSSAIFDYDNDGDMDILIGRNGSVGNKFLRNNLDTTNNEEEAFTNITEGSGFDTENSNNRDYIAYDFDNDGWVDVMGGGNKIMFNKGNGTFVASSYPMGVGAVGDMNNDGFLDILSGGQVYMNNGNPNKWIKIALEGIESNTNGIGARVELYGSWGKQIREIRSGEGFGYMSTLNAHFGIGTASAIDAVVIKWPSGTVDTILNPSSNQFLTVVEGSTLGIGQVESNTLFSIYPVPASEKLNIQFNNNSDIKTAKIIDLSGRVVDVKIENNAINVSALATGTYILSLKDNNGKQHTQKFVKN
ncbi:FG-GAP-like repeat-containing protein [Flavobacterium caeni]|uniref:Por secretion system C-terminal sorting domain-containing protein n=1 Tax=Flavobacterium caeni TaxID=490189 RepID=A0A1G5HRW9_9FLAO|nr:FG-GAP-like repeat-containing protein [Flavobacterium caeni]SCY65768.1 Por secretion system C-terminal sorting domain-containing protein [Flavobacterium caeni]